MLSFRYRFKKYRKNLDLQRKGSESFADEYCKLIQFKINLLHSPRLTKPLSPSVMSWFLLVTNQREYTFDFFLNSYLLIIVLLKLVS